MKTLSMMAGVFTKINDQNGHPHDHREYNHHPLAGAYIHYMPPPHDHPTLDLASVLQVVRPRPDYFGLSEIGTFTVAEDRLTTFSKSDDGTHQYLKLTEE